LHREIIINVLSRAIAAFDAFGIEICRVHASLASSENEAQRVSFQNLLKAQKKVYRLFHIDLSVSVDRKEWQFLNQTFQKRHLFQHSSGVIDDQYLALTNDPSALKGRKVTISRNEVVRMMNILQRVAEFVSLEFKKI
jgi:hypothetical protein